MVSLTVQGGSRTNLVVESSPSSDSSLSTGAVVGIAVGGASFVALVILLTWWLVRRSRRMAAMKAKMAVDQSPISTEHVSASEQKKIDGKKK